MPGNAHVTPGGSELDGAVPSDCQPLTREPNLKKKAEDNIAEYPTHIDTRVALLEQSLKYMDYTLQVIVKHIDKANDKIDSLHGKIDSRFLWLLSFMIAGFTGMFGVMAHGFHWF